MSMITVDAFFFSRAVKQASPFHFSYEYFAPVVKSFMSALWRQTAKAVLLLSGGVPSLTEHN